MIKPDELALFKALRSLPTCQPGVCAIIKTLASLGIHENRGHRILMKWSDRDWWDYGVSARGGWFTDTAPVELSEKYHGVARKIIIRPPARDATYWREE